jgi:MFS transporter, DHA3 family, multidrug efflux protein
MSGSGQPAGTRAAKTALAERRCTQLRQDAVLFGFAQSLETAASPATSFLIGPIAQVWVIPFMTTGAGAATIGGWFGTGPDRAMALLFIGAGLIGLVITVAAMRSRAYTALSARYADAVPATPAVPQSPARDFDLATAA